MVQQALPTYVTLFDKEVSVPKLERKCARKDRLHCNSWGSRETHAVPIKPRLTVHNNTYSTKIKNNTPSL